MTDSIEDLEFRWPHYGPCQWILPLFCNEERRLLMHRGDLHKNCATEILLALRARKALGVDLVRRLWCWLQTELTNAYGASEMSFDSHSASCCKQSFAR